MSICKECGKEKEVDFVGWCDECNNSIKFHDDIDQAFVPLKDFVSDFMEEEDTEETLGQYMYMFHDDEETHHYKHFGSRKYIKVNGKSIEGKIENWRKWK